MPDPEITTTPETARVITVALVGQADADLKRLRDRTGMSETDLINRAISLYEFADAQKAAGGQLVIERPGGGRWRVGRLRT